MKHPLLWIGIVMLMASLMLAGCGGAAAEPAPDAPHDSGASIPPQGAAPTPDNSSDATLTIAAVLECPEAADESCKRLPIEALFAVMQGEQVIKGPIVVRNAAEPITLTPGTYTIELLEPLHDPGFTAPDNQDITLAAGDDVMATFTFIQR